MPNNCKYSYAGNANTFKGTRVSPKINLWVEGKTDKKFYSEFVDYNKVECVQISPASETQFSGSKPSNKDRSQQERPTQPYYGQTIKELCRNDEKCYGIVDKDDGKVDVKDADLLLLKNLFVTDKRDLETSMLATDENLRRKVEKKCFYMSYQLSICRDNLKRDRSNGRSVALEETLGETLEKDWYFFDNNGKLHVSEFIEFLQKQGVVVKKKGESSNYGGDNNKSSNGVGNIKNELSKKLNKKKIYKMGVQEHDLSRDSVMWNEINGHIIAVVYAYINQCAREKYTHVDFRPNRAVEFMWIEQYNKEKFKSTNLYSKLKENHLAKT